ncbi:hypothetical protein PUN28_012491 [Cardiocondyla obscurior]|uniref:Uncharacterized protein n=1 Tax=Cardiocondyla obscurior TaxID=286306 RepID=A0AAW2FCZ4_9HYME
MHEVRTKCAVRHERQSSKDCKRYTRDAAIYRLVSQSEHDVIEWEGAALRLTVADNSERFAARLKRYAVKTGRDGDNDWVSRQNGSTKNVGDRL